VRGGRLEGVFEVDPGSLGLARRPRGELAGGSPEENAAILRRVLAGEAGGAARDVVLLNAAAGLVVGDAAASLEDGLDRATRAVDSGAAADLLERFCAFGRNNHGGHGGTPS
jgi:anthranilate phosphoribosyltransferase